MQTAAWNLPGRCALPYDCAEWLGLVAVAEDLAAIGFGKSRREPSCWRAVRLGSAPPAQDTVQVEPEPSCSRALLRWRDLLAGGPHPSPYRISRADR